MLLSEPENILLSPAAIYTDSQPLLLSQLSAMELDHFITKPEEIRRRFETATQLEFSQPWRPALVDGFLPGTVQLGLSHRKLWVLSTLDDEDIFTDATSDGQMLCTLGDVFEIFLQPPGKEAYFEFHMSPQNHKLQLRFPNPEAIQRIRHGEENPFNPNDGLWNSSHFPQLFFDSRVLVEDGRWSVLAAVDLPLLSAHAQGTFDDISGLWHASFGRYDCAPSGRSPVISTCTPHLQADFHRTHEFIPFLITE